METGDDLMIYFVLLPLDFRANIRYGAVLHEYLVGGDDLLKEELVDGDLLQHGVVANFVPDSHDIVFLEHLPCYLVSNFLLNFLKLTI